MWTQLLLRPHFCWTFVKIRDVHVQIVRNKNRPVKFNSASSHVSRACYYPEWFVLRVRDFKSAPVNISKTTNFMLVFEIFTHTDLKTPNCTPNVMILQIILFYLYIFSCNILSSGTCNPSPRMHITLGIWVRGYTYYLWSG